MSQTAYSLAAVRGQPGDWAGGGARDAVTVAAGAQQQVGTSGHLTGGGLTPGRLAVRRDQALSEHPVAIHPEALAADPAAIIAAGVSAAAPQSITASGFDGVVGAEYFPVPALIDMVLSASADWLLSSAVLTGVGADGATITETLSIPAGGNTTLTTTQAFWRLTQLDIDAQAGATGTYTLGVSASGRELGGGLLLGLVEIDEERPDQTTIPALGSASAARLGRYYVQTNEQVTIGAPAFVTVVTTVGKPAGSFRSDADGGAAAALAGARYVRADDASTAVVEIGEL